MSNANGIPISAVSARTGVPVATLRAWERRFDFPRPVRLAGGHRRYSERDVDRISSVISQRERGRTLQAAIAAVDEPHEAGPSIFAGVRDARPDLPVHLLSRRAMLAISRAIEDEARARGGRSLVVGAFQTEAAYRRVQARWDDLARTASAAIVFAEFDETRRVEGSADEVALPTAAPLRREWAVICAGPAFSACLTGWSRSPGFEATWSVEPDVVRTAARLGLALAASHAPDLALPEAREAGLDDVDSTVVAQSATALTSRALAHLDGLTRSAP